MTDEVVAEEIRTYGNESDTSPYGGHLWIRCDGDSLSATLIANARGDAGYPKAVRVRLDKGKPFTPRGWTPVWERGRTVIRFEGRARDELFAHLDSTDVVTVRLEGQYGRGPRSLTFPLPSRGFRRATRKLPCVDWSAIDRSNRTS